MNSIIKIGLDLSIGQQIILLQNNKIENIL